MHKLEPKMVLAYYFLHFTILNIISADIMVDNIDMFKNDVRYRENIAHIETIPAKEASFRKVDNLNERIVDYLDSKNVKLYEHQAETYEAIKAGEELRRIVGSIHHSQVFKGEMIVEQIGGAELGIPFIRRLLFKSVAQIVLVDQSFQIIQHGSQFFLLLRISEGHLWCSRRRCRP